MEVFVQGATGVLGRRLVRAFAAAGDEVVGLARNDEGDAAVRAAGGTPARADIYDAAALAKAAEGAEVVIRAATHIPKGTRLAPRHFAENAKLRTEGTKALLAAASRAGAKVFLQESIVWVARPPDGSPFDEDSPVQADGITASMIEAENLARSVGADGRLTTTTLRLGNLYAPEAWHTRLLAERLKAHKLPLIGPGTAQTCIVHADDAASAFVAAAHAPLSGIFHVLDDQPTSVKDVLGDLADRIGAGAQSHVPPWLARLAAGTYTVEFFTAPMRTSNARFKQAFGWRPQYPTYRETLDQIVGEWKREGFLGLSP
jgi:nucleoside-diphosphate-sugar epimerase